VENGEWKVEVESGVWKVEWKVEKVEWTNDVAAGSVDLKVGGGKK
jgi:hypothetical protein